MFGYSDTVRSSPLTLTLFQCPTVSGEACIFEADKDNFKIVDRVSGFQSELLKTAGWSIKISLKLRPILSYRIGLKVRPIC